MRRAFCVAIFAFAAAFTAAQPVLAAAQITLGIGEGRRILLRGTTANVVVSDPAVADVTVVDSHSVILIGKNYGAAQVMVFDHGGRSLLDDRVIVGAPDTGRVSLHAGMVSSEYACAPHCQMVQGAFLTAPIMAAPATATTTTMFSSTTRTNGAVGP